MTYRSPEDFLARGSFLGPIKPRPKKKNGHAFSDITNETGAPPPFDERFPQPLGETAEARPPAHAKGFIEFFSQYKPINYTIDGILPGGSIYGVTAKRSSGKTAFLTGSALAVLADRGDILGFDVEKGRVAYIILENPIDFLMEKAFGDGVRARNRCSGARQPNRNLRHEAPARGDHARPQGERRSLRALPARQLRHLPGRLRWREL
jgi:hypothetical protein